MAIFVIGNIPLTVCNQPVPVQHSDAYSGRADHSCCYGSIDFHFNSLCDQVDQIHRVQEVAKASISLRLIDRALNINYNENKETKKQRNKEIRIVLLLMHIIKKEATMEHIAIRSKSKMERKIISVSVKRQVTIPQKYFEALGFDNEAECILQEGGILLRPIRDTSSGEFSEQILADLIVQGFSGQELLKKFKEQSKKARPAVKRLIEEADAMAKSGEGKVSLDEIFGTEKQ